jgi:CHAD domain-containing protein
MLTKKRQQQYFRQRWENIMHHFGQFAKRTNANDIHKLRVELKKIRALIVLRESVGIRFSAHAKKLVRALFKQAGKIRDAQVSAQLVKQMGAGSADFFLHQRNAVEKESKRFVKLVSKHTDELIETNAAAWRKLSAIPFSDVKKYVGKTMRTLKKAYRPRLKQADLHESRKLIKRLVYLDSLLKEKDRKLLKQNIELLRNLEEEVGKWHDAVVTGDLLKDFRISGRRKTQLDAHRKSQLEKISKLSKGVF